MIPIVWRENIICDVVYYQKSLPLYKVLFQESFFYGYSKS